MTTTPAASGGRAALLAAARAELAEHGQASISLRAVARRAGVSHAAPKYHFADRAGLLTAVAAEGFLALAEALHQVCDHGPADRVAAMGRAYIDFGLANPALFDLMFRRGELHDDDPALEHGRRAAFTALSSVVAHLEPSTGSPAPGVPVVALASWALVHGLVTLTRDGALHGVVGETAQTAPELGYAIAEMFSAYLDDSQTTGRG